MRRASIAVIPLGQALTPPPWTRLPLNITTTESARPVSPNRPRPYNTPITTINHHPRDTSPLLRLWPLKSRHPLNSETLLVAPLTRGTRTPYLLIRSTVLLGSLLYMDTPRRQSIVLSRILSMRVYYVCNYYLSRFMKHPPIRHLHPFMLAFCEARPHPQCIIATRNCTPLLITIMII